MLLTKSLTCMFFFKCFFFSHVVFEVCIYADPCTVYEQKQRHQRLGNKNDDLKKITESGQN